VKEEGRIQEPEVRSQKPEQKNFLAEFAEFAKKETAFFDSVFLIVVIH
jgi:hypothetical protein